MATVIECDRCGHRFFWVKDNPDFYHHFLKIDDQKTFDLCKKCSDEIMEKNFRLHWSDYKKKYMKVKPDCDCKDINEIRCADCAYFSMSRNNEYAMCSKCLHTTKVNESEADCGDPASCRICKYLKITTDGYHLCTKRGRILDTNA